MNGVIFLETSIDDGVVLWCFSNVMWSKRRLRITKTVKRKPLDVTIVVLSYVTLQFCGGGVILGIQVHC